MKCQFCGNQGELHDIEVPAIRLCTVCREKLTTHIVVVCTGCDTLHWLPKTPQNVMQAAHMSGLAPDHIMDNYMLHEIKRCQQCYEALKEFSRSTTWKQ